jgi:hypothetical protein
MLNGPSVYFLIKRGVVVYIGQTIHIVDRLFQHKASLMDYDVVKIIPCNADKLLHYEARWIKLFRPVHNKTHKGIGANKRKKIVSSYKWKTKNMHFRKLTEKSFIGFGKHKNEKVSRMIELGKVGYLASIYYNLSHITFFDSVLDTMGLTQEWRIEKPGVDKEKFYAFCEAVLPEYVEMKKRMYEKIKHKKSMATLKWETGINRNKHKLKTPPLWRNVQVKNIVSALTL